MLTEINPKLPMREKSVTRDFYIRQLGFAEFGSADFDGYLMVQKDNVQIHFFEFKDLDPKGNYGQVYIRTDDIKTCYRVMKNLNVNCTELQYKPWGQIEFSILDPDSNLLTFGETLP